MPKTQESCPLRSRNPTVRRSEARSAQRALKALSASLPGLKLQDEKDRGPGERGDNWLRNGAGQSFVTYTV